MENIPAESVRASLNRLQEKLLSSSNAHGPGILWNSINDFVPQEVSTSFLGVGALQL